jgi:glucokinase
VSGPPTPTVGVDVGGTKLLGLLVGPAGGGAVPVLAQQRVPTPHGGDAIVDAVVKLWEELSGVGPRPAALGIGAPGLVDRAGRLRFAPNLPGVTELELGPRVRERIGGVPVAVENDATCAGWGERTHGAGRGADDVVLVTLGTGIGGGIVCGGLLLLGASGFAGEIGHMVVDPNGPPCPCGQRGCWERFASGSGLGWLGRNAAVAGKGRRIVEIAGGDVDAVRGEDVTAAAVEGDVEALAVIDQFAWWLALGLANLANTFDPSVIVIGGGLVEAGDLLLAPARAAFEGMVEGAEHRPPVPIVAAQLGEQAGAIGAAGRAAMLLRS